MKILYYITEGLAPSHAGKMAEVIHDLTSKNHDVHVVNCGNHLSNCFLNPTHNIVACSICQSRTNHLLKQANVPSKNIVTYSCPKQNRHDSIPKFDNLEALMSHKYKGINVGRGAASSIISLKRDYTINSIKYGELIQAEIVKSMHLLDFFETHIEKLQPEKIYMFNGRFSECFPLLELAKKNNIPYATVESGSSASKYMIFENSLPHSIEEWDHRANSYWDSQDKIERVELAKKWYEAKKKGTHTNDKSYIKDQKKDNLPINFDPSKTNITIFNSSEDEMKAISEWDTSLFSSQNQAIDHILNQFNGNKEIHFFLRVHPNLGNVKNSQVEEISKMNYPNLTIIDAKSNIDTYSLMEKSSKIICFGSTIGAEATYWGVPSILYGKSFYLKMDTAYVPQSFEELTKLILDPNLLPKPKHNSYKYGLYVSQFGFNPTHFVDGGKYNSKFKQKKIKRIYWDTIFYFFKYITNLKRWTHMQKVVNNSPLTIKHFFKL